MTARKHATNWFRAQGINPEHVTQDFRVEWDADGGTVHWNGHLNLNVDETKTLLEAIEQDARERATQ